VHLRPIRDSAFRFGISALIGSVQRFIGTVRREGIAENRSNSAAINIRQVTGGEAGREIIESPQAVTVNWAG
jgi:hypothetical protein